MRGIVHWKVVGVAREQGALAPVDRLLLPSLLRSSIVPYSPEQLSRRSSSPLACRPGLWPSARL